ncbi:ABC-three component system protein [Crassaminicella profunda]|uniref:ABC-three component system protein n=1 Tax=Crassaminicella profunda TaxID=1286698 RepID=UPI001CA70602|nr:ABC-three component system protein [Crassaminicella profunda]QZY56665.1 hypothetical protein K7H06_07020 [Crassaminicella profunda]
MLNSNKQDIAGDHNQQAGHDIININLREHRKALTFYEEDIKDVIIYFSRNINYIDGNIDDMKKIPLEEKNEINGLSEDYFEIIKEDFMEYFAKIDTFLKDPKNVEYLEMYQGTVGELKHKITIRRKYYEYFEEIFEDLYDYIFKRNKKEIKSEKGIIWVFLHYMYCNCDIGKKCKEE